MRQRSRRADVRLLAKHGGMTLLELVVALVILAGLAAVLVPSLGQVFQSTERSAAQASLTEVRNGFLRYWQDVKHTAVVQQALQQSVTDPEELLRLVQPRWLLENPDTDLDGEPDFFPPFDPATQIGWRGPYFVNDPTPYRYTSENNTATGIIDDPSFVPDYAGVSDPYGQPDDSAIRDPFVSNYLRPLGRPIVIQTVPAWIETTGPAGIDARLSHIDVRVVSAGENGQLEIPLTDPSGAPLWNRALQMPQNANLRGDDLYVAFEVRP